MTVKKKNLQDVNCLCVIVLLYLQNETKCSTEVLKLTLETVTTAILSTGKKHVLLNVLNCLLKPTEFTNLQQTSLLMS